MLLFPKYAITEISFVHQYKPDDIDDALDTNIDEVVTDGKATVVSSAWYTINGVRVAEPKQRGIYIRQDKMSDGTTQSVKVMVR